MKKSLELLDVQSSGIEANIAIRQAKKNEEEVEFSLDEILDPAEKENYLKKLLEKRPHGFVKAKRTLANLLREKDLKYSIELIMSASLSAPLDSENYFLLAEIAFHHNAFVVAEEAISVVKWLSIDNNLNLFKKAEVLEELISEKIKSKSSDNSKNEFWYGKVINKFWILEKLYFQASYKELLDCSFKLLTIFPSNLSNYFAVYKSLVLLDDKESLKKFIEYINKDFSNDELNKNLLLGMVYYSISDFNTAISFLNNALKVNRIHPKALLYLSLNFLMQSNIKDFIRISNMILPESEVEFIATYFISSALADVQMKGGAFPDHKNIANNVVKIMLKLIQNNKVDIVVLLVDKFKQLDYFAILPFLPLYLAEFFIKANFLDRAKDILLSSSDPEVHRLNAWILRIEGKNDLAENELLKYRKEAEFEAETSYFCQAISLKLPSKSPDKVEEIFKNVDDAYKQAGDLIKEFDLEYGLNAMTCIETTCQDCCTKTFPLVTYTEYLYMRHWLDKQSEELRAKIHENSKNIVKMYKERYGKEPPFLIGEKADSKKDYPNELYFNCPFLGDNKCNVYEARPFTCRAYSYSSFSGITFKGCNYFYEQFKRANKLSNVRKVIDAKSFFNFAKLTDTKLIGEKVMAPLPVWFAQNHEETVAKAKKALP